MGLFSFFSSKGMNEYVQEARSTKGAIIVDVRSPAEFAQGHVKGAVNIPSPAIKKIATVAPDRQTPLYLHCLSGARSAGAARALKALGYVNVTNMGGISHYDGELVKGSK